MSLWSKLTKILPKRNKPIGYDLQGNAYFELPGPTGPKRIVEYNKKNKAHDWRLGTQQLPVQWTAWLSYTRNTPPSLAELRADEARLQRLQPLIAEIERREREERIQQGYLLPDGTEPAKESQQGFQVPGSQAAGVAFPYPLDAEPSQQVEAPKAPQHEVSDSEFIAPPREKVDPSQANSAEELRKLAEEDTKRRLRESGVAEGSGASEGVEGVGRTFKPRRRGGAK